MKKIKGVLGSNYFPAGMIAVQVFVWAICLATALLGSKDSNYNPSIMRGAAIFFSALLGVCILNLILRRKKIWQSLREM